MTNDDALYWKNRALKAEDRVRELAETLRRLRADTLTTEERSAFINSVLTRP